MDMERVGSRGGAEGEGEGEGGHVSLRCRTRGAQLLYSVGGDLVLPDHGERRRLRERFGSDHWYTAAARSLLEPLPTLAQLAGVEDDDTGTGDSRSRTKQALEEGGAECLLYRPGALLRVEVGKTTTVVAVREDMEDSNKLQLTTLSPTGPIQARLLPSAAAPAIAGTAAISGTASPADGAAGGGGSHVAVLMLSHRREVFVYQRGDVTTASGARAPALASELECFIWGVVGAGRGPRTEALLAARAFTGYQELEEVTHLCDRVLDGAGCVSIFLAHVHVGAKGEPPFAPTSRWESGRFLPLRSVLALMPLEPAALGALATHLGLGAAAVHDLCRLDPFLAHLPLPLSARARRRPSYLAGQSGPGFCGSPALEKCAFHLPVQVVGRRPRARRGVLAVAIEDISLAATTPPELLQVCACGHPRGAAVCVCWQPVCVWTWVIPMHPPVAAIGGAPALSVLVLRPSSAHFLFAAHAYLYCPRCSAR